MATTSRIFLNRIKKELANLENDPPPGITCYPIDDDITHLECYLQGPTQTPYEKGIYQLDIKMPNNYPFDPPQIRFITPIYHPNIDEGGRICASILKKTEDGWKPSMNLSTTLISLHNLISAPNPDDPLDADIANEYKMDHDLFLRKAKEHTLKYATTDSQNKTANFSSQPSVNMNTTTTNNNNNHIDSNNSTNNNNNNYQITDKNAIVIDDDDDDDDIEEVVDISSQTTPQNNKKSKLSLSRNKSSSQQLTSFSSQDSSKNKSIIVIDSDDSDDSSENGISSQVIITQNNNNNNNKSKLSLSTNKIISQQSTSSSQDSFMKKKSLLSIKKKASITHIEKNNTNISYSSQENQLSKSSLLSTKNKTSTASTFIENNNTTISSLPSLSSTKNNIIEIISLDSPVTKNNGDDDDDTNNNNNTSAYFKQNAVDRAKVNDITNDIYNQPEHHSVVIKGSAIINNGLAKINDQNNSVLDNTFNNEDNSTKRKRNNKISLSCKKKAKN